MAVLPELALSQIPGAGCDPKETVLLTLLTWVEKLILLLP